MNSNIDEKVWVIQMSSLLNDGDKIDIKNPVSIFQVPKSIRITKPEAYTPQVVALGPYHHFRPKTYYMQKCKLSAALKARQQLKLREIPEMIDAIKDRLFDIRASYHDSLSLENETLAWMMLIDGLFLMSLIEKKENSHEGELNDQLEDLRGRTHSLNAILKDVVMLENQVPEIVLEALVAVESESNWTNKRAGLMYKLTNFCTDLSPIALQGNMAPREMKDPHHVLDFLHQLVWLGKESLVIKAEAYMGFNIEESDVNTWSNLYGLLSNIKFGPMVMILAMVDLTLKILNALGISVPRDIFSEKEVLIPSASQLTDVGVKFCGIKRMGGGVKGIDFSQRTESVTLSLPLLNTNINSDLLEVAMRNLLAYEAEEMPESPKFSRYVEIMSGLMQTIADVDLLKNADAGFHIVPQDANSLKVVELFAGLKEAVGSKGKSELDDTIDKVKVYYDNCRKVKIRRLAKRYLFVSWKVLTGVALILVLILLLLQTFCSIYSCPKIFKSQQLAYLAL